MNTRFKLFACCIPVKGALRSGICDLQRGTFTAIPNELYEILDQARYADIASLASSYALQDQPVLQEYITWLMDNEFGFFCSDEESDLFPEMDTKWEMPHTVTNAIVDLNAESFRFFPSTLKQLIELAVPCIQVRAFEVIDLPGLIKILDAASRSRIKQFEIVIPYYPEIENIDLFKLLRPMMRIHSIIVYGSPEQRQVDVIKGLITVLFKKEKLSGPENCGCVSKDHFVINKDLFLESLRYNSCLNRKITVDQHGEIRNCPSMAKSFGNIRAIALRDVAADKTFQELWGITKDAVKTCQDCEFRYICTDCRAYLQNPHDLHSKPLKCGYNPYTAKWEDWKKEARMEIK